MDVIDELIACCEAWEPEVCVMGNVRAGEAAKALRGLRADLTMAGAFHKAAVAQRNSAWEEIDRLRRAEGHSVATALGQQETIEGLRAELAECIVALEKIANPISAMKRALPVGATLNGAMATTLSNDPNYLKEIAKAALAARKGEEEGDGHAAR
jgi:hypothetical protein